MKTLKPVTPKPGSVRIISAIEKPGLAQWWLGWTVIDATEPKNGEKPLGSAGVF